MSSELAVSDSLPAVELSSFMNNFRLFEINFFDRNIFGVTCEISRFITWRYIQNTIVWGD